MSRDWRKGRIIHCKKYISKGEKLKCYSYFPQHDRFNPGIMGEHIDQEPADHNNKVSAYDGYSEPLWYPSVYCEKYERRDEKKLISQRVKESP